jgi:sulfate permease, SulP family
MSTDALAVYLNWLENQVESLAGFILRPVDLIRHYDLDYLRADAIAGLTVAVIALPQAMAYALIAELPPEIGLYAAIVGALVGALWGSSRHLQNGPTNTVSLLVLSVLLAIGNPGASGLPALAALMAVLVGLIQLILALARLGVMVNFISDAVIVGFTAGAGILIFINQIRNLLGLHITSSPHPWEMIPEITSHIGATNLSSLWIGVGVIVLLLILRRVNRKLPAPLIAIIVSSLIVFFFGLDERGISVVGELPRGLPPLTLPKIDMEMIQGLLTGAAAVAAIGLVESISIARSIASQTNQRLDSNQEFFGQGLANIASGLFGGYPVAGSFTRSVINYDAGARTAVSNLFVSLFLLIAVLFLGPLAAYVPQPALAGVIIVTAYGLVDWEEIRRIWRSNHVDRTIMVFTLAATLVLPLEYAVLSGIGLSLLTYLLQTSKPTVRVVLPSDDFRYFTPRPGKPSCPQLGVIEILGDLYFGAVNHIEEKIMENVNAHPGQTHLLLRMYPVENCDISGIHVLENIKHFYRDRGGDVYFVHVHRHVRELMKSTDFYECVGSDHFLDPDEAIKHLFHHVLNPAICIYECPVRVFKYCQNLPKRLDLVCPTLQLNGMRGNVTTVTPEALWEQLSHSIAKAHAPSLVIIDVREPREYRRAHIPQAKRIGFHDLLEDPSQIPLDEEVTLVCEGGRRSTCVAAILSDRGHENVQVLEGGMRAWRQKQLLTAVADVRSTSNE